MKKFQKFISVDDPSPILSHVYLVRILGINEIDWRIAQKIYSILKVNASDDHGAKFMLYGLPTSYYQSVFFLYLGSYLDNFCHMLLKLWVIVMTQTFRQI